MTIEELKKVLAKKVNGQGSAVDVGGGGLCLTYADCENVETIAYNKTESGWAFDDKTVTHIGQ